MLTVEYARDLVWNNPEKTSFTCFVKYKEFNEEHPSGIVPTDPYAHIQEVWQNGINGVYGPIKEYEPPPNESVLINHEKISVTTFEE